jgi:hypothetical protein
MIPWQNILFWTSSIVRFFKTRPFCKPAVLLSSSKEVPNLVDSWDRVKVFTRLRDIFLNMEAHTVSETSFFLNIRRWTAPKKEDCISESYITILFWTDSSMISDTNRNRIAPSISSTLEAQLLTGSSKLHLLTHLAKCALVELTWTNAVFSDPIM